MKRYGRRWSMVTDRLRSYGAAMKVIGNSPYFPAYPKNQWRLGSLWTDTTTIISAVRLNPLERGRGRP